MEESTCGRCGEPCYRYQHLCSDCMNKGVKVLMDNFERLTLKFACVPCECGGLCDNCKEAA
jgi:hypothetical protein